MQAIPFTHTLRTTQSTSRGFLTAPYLGWYVSSSLTGHQDVPDDSPVRATIDQRSTALFTGRLL